MVNIRRVEVAGKPYQVTLDGTCYHEETDTNVVEALQHARKANKNVRFMYGDVETGESWLDEYDVDGYLGRSMGPVKATLILPDRKSLGGPAILEHCIIYLMVAGEVKYKHPKFKTPELNIEPCDEGKWKWAVRDEKGVLHARFTTEAKAKRWVDFMQGKLMKL